MGFNRETSNQLLEDTLDYLNKIKEEREIHWVIYSTLHNMICALYDSFSEVDEPKESEGEGEA